MNMSHKKKFTLGIYGDGQLARLLALSALSQNLSVLIYTLDAQHSPCKDLAPLQQGPSWTDKKSFFDFCEQCETVVLENEFVPAELLLQAENHGTKIFPDAKSFSQVSNKLKQVELAQNLGLKVPSYQVIDDASQLTTLSLPVMLKSLSGGYDGYGNFTFTRPEQIEAAKAFIHKGGKALA